MTIQDFMLEARDAVIEDLKDYDDGNYIVEIKDVVKTNDQILHGLMVKREDRCYGVNFYLDEMYERHEEGEDMKDILVEVICKCRDALSCPVPAGPALGSMALKDIHDRLTVRLIDVTRNRSYMAGRPYIDLGNGLALIADINATESILSEWRMVVTTDLLETIGCSKEELLTAAMANTMDMEPPLLMSLSDMVIESDGPNLLDHPEMRDDNYQGGYCLTNMSKYKGAAALFYPGVMERTADMLGCGYYVIPSSIHEMIIVPDSLNPDVRGMTEALRSGNQEVVEDIEDILSYKVFHFDPDEGRLMTVRRSA